MADIIFVAIALTFFGLASLYVLGCDRIIGRGAPTHGGDGATGSGPAASDRTESRVSS